MDSSSVKSLYQQLISSAIQRCRLFADLCRLSVILKSSFLSSPPLLRISVSDTGVGSCLEEFQNVKYPRDPNFDEIWDGLISVATTNICDKEIYHYNLNLKESDEARRLTKLPSKLKNGAKFSGTEVSLTVTGSFNELAAEITCFIQKMLILKIPKVAVELKVDCSELPECQCSNIILANDCIPLPAESNIACLKLGLEGYVLKHGNRLDNICQSCFSCRECLKIGSGVTCSAESNRSTGMMVEAVIIISQSSPLVSPCLAAWGTKTEILHFKDFTPCSVSQTSLSALTSIDWKAYGLVVKKISDQGGCLVLEWENLPPDSHIDIAIHCYYTQVIMPPAKKRTGSDRNLIRKAVKLAMDDVKDKNAGVLLSAHAAKICSYAPDLARTMAGLILSSNDLSFQKECISLLGLNSQGIESKVVEDCIKDRILSVIEVNDRKPQKTKEAASFLFEDESSQEPEFIDEEYGEGEEAFNSLDL